MRRTKGYYEWDSLPILITTQEAACVLRVSEVCVRALLRSGKLRGVKAGKDWRVCRDALRDFAEGGITA